MPNLISVRFANGHRPAEYHNVKFARLDITQKNRPVDFTDTRGDAVLSKLVLQDESNAFPSGVAGVYFDFKTKRNFLTADYLIKYPVPVGIVPASLFQKLETLSGIKWITRQAFIVLRTKEINRPLYHLP